MWETLKAMLDSKYKAEKNKSKQRVIKDIDGLMWILENSDFKRESNEDNVLS